MYQEISFVNHVEKISFVDSSNTFSFRKDAKAHWLQKLCFAILRKLGAFHQMEMVTIERHTIDSSSFVERLFKQKEGIHKFFNKRPKVLLIGAKDYAELMQSKEFNQQFSFQAQYFYGNDRVVQIFGLEVKVIPWMSGVLVMPDDY